MSIKLVLRPYSSALCVKNSVNNAIAIVTEMNSHIFMKLLLEFFCFL